MATALQTLSKAIHEPSVAEKFNARLVDSSISFEREAGFAIQALGASEYLAKQAAKNLPSLLSAITNIAAIGISLNPAKKQAYLVPRKGAVCLDISYMGMLELAMSSGSIRWGQAKLVYSKDTFEVHGLDKQPTHTYSPFATDRGDVVGVYCTVKTSDGDYLTDTMTVEEINGIRARSESFKRGGKGPWATDWGEMARKTVVKRAYKYWPKTDRLSEAINYLDTEGGEGISDAPEHPSALQEWVDKVNACQSLERLRELWQPALIALKQHNNIATLSSFKEAFKQRGEELKAVEANTYEGEANEVG